MHTGFVTLSLLATAGAAAQPVLEPMPIGGAPHAISSDGRSAAGVSFSEDCFHTGQGSRWTAQDGWSTLGVCGFSGSETTDISGDGGVIFYQIFASSGAPDYCGLWTEAGGAQQLPEPEGDWTGVYANAVSSDGLWVAADWWLNFSYTVPYVWSVDRGQWYRLVPEGQGYVGTVSAVANNGIAAGVQNDLSGGKDWKYLRWTPSGADALPLPLGISIKATQKFAITTGGEVIVAAPIGAFGQLVFWLDEGQRYAVATGVSLDGNFKINVTDDLRIVIGTKVEGAGKAFPGIWTPRNGTRRLLDVLVDAGVDLTGWTVTAITDMTPDGRVIVGYGTDPDGNFRGFRITGRLYCSPDCNDDGKLNINDFICFQSKWRAQDFYADYNLDGKWNVNDFIAFQADWQRGCE